MLTIAYLIVDWKQFWAGHRRTFQRNHGYQQGDIRFLHWQQRAEYSWRNALWAWSWWVPSLHVPATASCPVQNSSMCSTSRLQILTGGRCLLWVGLWSVGRHWSWIRQWPWPEVGGFCSHSYTVALSSLLLDLSLTTKKTKRKTKSSWGRELQLYGWEARWQHWGYSGTDFQSWVS